MFCKMAAQLLIVVKLIMVEDGLTCGHGLPWSGFSVTRHHFMVTLTTIKNLGAILQNIVACGSP